MKVCMYACMYVLYVCMYVCMYVRMYVTYLPFDNLGPQVGMTLDAHPHRSLQHHPIQHRALHVSNHVDQAEA